MSHMFTKMKILSIFSTICWLILVVPAMGQGTLMVMGNNENGQLGDGTMLDSHSPISIDTDVVTIEGGLRHSLYIKADGTLMAMGANLEGGLGDGTTNDRSSPVVIDSNVIAVAGGIKHSLYVKADGTLMAMGLNEEGQLGDGTTTTRHTAVVIDSNVVAVSAGNNHSHYLKADGTLMAMGLNDVGQLGDGTQINRTSPVTIASSVLVVTAGFDHTLFVKTDGTLMATGQNDFGQLGDSNHFNRVTPVQIDTGVATVSAGGWHSFYIKVDGTLMAMGYNDFGQLGVGTLIDNETPIVVDTAVIEAVAGAAFSLYLTEDRTLRAMGSNFFGQFGTGTTNNRASPEAVDVGVSGISSGGWHSLYVKALVKTVQVAAAGGSSSASYQADASWTAKTSDDWISVTTASGSAGLQNIQFTTTANPLVVGRTGGIRVESGGELVLWIKVVQAAADGAVPVAMSVRADVGSGANILIPGMIFKGPDKTKLVLRGIGPALANVGVNGALVDPQIVIYSGATPIANNDDWKEAPDDLVAYFKQVGLSPLADGTKDAAAYLELNAGVYTMHLSGVGGTTGIGLAEVYVVDPAVSGSGLVALSARAEVGQGARVVIPGFVITGNQSRRVLIRGIGPGLAASVPGFLPDPQVEVYSGANSIDFNEDWEDDDPTNLSAAFVEAGLTAFAPGSKDAAILVTLPPGVYTAHIRSSNITVGVALLELYFLD